MQPPPGLFQQISAPNFSNQQVPPQPPGLNIQFNQQGPQGNNQKNFPAQGAGSPMQQFSVGFTKQKSSHTQHQQVKNYTPFQKQMTHGKMHQMQYIQNQTLESLDIGLKVDDTDQSIKTQNKQAPNLNHVSIKLDQGEINSEFCYIEPRIQDLLVTSQGLIFDSTNNDSVGLWDKQLNLQRYYSGLLNPFAGNHRIIPLQGNKLLVNSEQKFTIIDLNDATMKEIWDCKINTQYFDLTNHQIPRLYAVCNDQFCIWRMKNIAGKGADEPIFNVNALNANVIKSNDDLELIKTIRTRFAYCENIIVLDNGIVLGKNNQDGEVFYLNLENEEVSEVHSIQGDTITLWAKINYDTVAMGRDQSTIMIVEFKTQFGKVIKQILLSKEDVLQQMILFPHNNIAGVTCNGNVRVWDMDTGKCLKEITNTYIKSQSHYNLKLVDEDTLLIHSNDEKYLQLYKVDQKPTLELTNYINLMARVRVVNFCNVSPCGNYICLIQECGTFRNGELDFRTEIEVYKINCPVSKSMHRKKIIDGTLEASNVTFFRGTCVIQKSKSIELKNENEIQQSQDHLIQEEPSILYVLPQQKGQSSGQLVQWFFNQDQVVNDDLQVENFDRCKIYSFDRLVFSFSYEKMFEVQNLQSHDSYDMFAPSPSKRQNPSLQNYSGLVIYNSEQKLLLTVKFDQPFKTTVFEMPNCNFVFFLNSKNTIEAWNVITQSMIQKADCRPSTIINLRFQNQQPQQLFLMGQGEWIVRNFKLGLICKRKADKTQLYKMEFLDDETCVVLHGKKILEVWNLKENKSQVITVNFDLSDFFVHRNEMENSVIVVGDYSMKKVFSQRRDGF